jgi:hypothetical protein
VAPGGVTPFAPINDRERRVQPLLDRAILSYEQLNHNPPTKAATRADLPKFIGACGQEARILELDATGIATTPSSAVGRQSTFGCPPGRARCTHG